MQWSMPRPVLQVVAVLLGLIALGALSLGIASAPSRGRLPGEGLPDTAAGAAIQATEATPLGDERIEGPPPPKPLTEEEKAKLEEEKKAKEEAEAAAKLAAADAEKALPTPKAAPAQPPADRVGDLLDSVTPPPQEEPPH